MVQVSALLNANGSAGELNLVHTIHDLRISSNPPTSLSSFLRVIMAKKKNKVRRKSRPRWLDAQSAFSTCKKKKVGKEMELLFFLLWHLEKKLEASGGLGQKKRIRLRKKEKK